MVISFLATLSDVSADSQFSLLPGMMYFDYEERAEDGSFLDAETDPVPGITLAMDYRHSKGMQAEIRGGIYSGNVEYDGHARPSGQPVTTYTKSNFFNLGATAKYPLQLSGPAIYFTFGYEIRRWERDIRATVNPAIGSVSGLYEVYKWEELSMGIEIRPELKFPGRWRFYGGVFQTVDPRIEIDLKADGNGEPRLYMGTDTGYMLGARWMGDKSRGRVSPGVKLSYKTWRFGRSNSEVLPDSSVVTEPRSETHLITLEFIFGMFAH